MTRLGGLLRQRIAADRDIGANATTAGNGYFLSVTKRTGEFVEISALIERAVVKKTWAGCYAKNCDNHHHEHKLDNRVARMPEPRMPPEAARAISGSWR